MKTPFEDDTPPPKTPEIPFVTWVLAGAALALAFCLVLILLRTPA